MARRGVTCVVQARTGSVRLPGKVLADLGGRPLLAFMLRRLRELDVDDVVVATSDRPADDAVAELARAEGAAVVRGPEEDVLARFALALDAHPADALVRLTADCPLVDPEVVEEAVGLWDESGADYVSNTLVRTFPDGLDVEVVAAAALRAAAAEATDPVEREHVTPFVYRRPDRFRLRSLRHDEPLGDLRWTVDTDGDLAYVRGLVERLGGDDFGWQDVLAVAGRPQPPDDGFSFVPAGPDDESAVLALRNDPESVRWSLDPRPVEPGRHAAWFASVLEDPRTRMWVARQAGEVVGQVRVDVEDGTGWVSIAVVARARGRGCGARMLEELAGALGADEQVHTLLAHVHGDNLASCRLFESAGFSPGDRDGDFLLMGRPART